MSSLLSNVTDVTIEIVNKNLLIQGGCFNQCCEKSSYVYGPTWKRVQSVLESVCFWEAKSFQWVSQNLCQSLFATYSRKCHFQEDIGKVWKKICLLYTSDAADE